jgi:DNA-binding transcriptional ArsR family regulator
MADIFDVISDPTRRQLMGVLLQRVASTPSGEISVGDMVDHLGLSQPTVSKHLKVLRDHGLVTVREDGQHRYYHLDAGPLGQLEDWLAPFIAADEADELPIEDGGSAVFAAWAGTDVGENIGRRIADSSHQARNVLHGASDRVAGLPDLVRKRLFGAD